MTSEENSQNYKSEITGKIIGAAMDVHNELGPHYMEVVYQRALQKELRSIRMNFGREVEIPIHYKGEQIATRRVDFLIEDILVELKAKEDLDSQDYEQLLSYLKTSGYKLGLIINFGAKKLQFKRIIYG